MGDPATEPLGLRGMIRVAALALLLTGLSAPPAAAADWEEILQEDGITVWRRPVEGSSFVEFRGKGIIDTSVRRILAVLHDQERKTEWMHQCVDNKLVVAHAVGEMTVYNRTGSGFPLVSDRDVVARSKLHQDLANKRIHIEVHSVEHPAAPPQSGVVRMPKLDLSWTFDVLETGKTLATYQVAADPGGLLPAWVVNLVSKKIPWRTISNLRNQVKKDGYERSQAIVDMSFDWEAVGMK